MQMQPVILKSNGHYSSGMISGKLLFISGMLSVDPVTGSRCIGNIRQHMQTALLNVEKVLLKAQLSREDVVQCRIYTTDVAYWNDINEVFADFFKEHRPARVVVPVADLHFGCLVEIEAIAEIK